MLASLVHSHLADERYLLRYGSMKPDSSNEKPLTIGKIAGLNDADNKDLEVIIYPNTIQQFFFRPFLWAALFLIAGIVIGVLIGWEAYHRKEGPFPSREWIRLDSSGEFYLHKATGLTCALNSMDKDLWLQSQGWWCDDERIAKDSNVETVPRDIQEKQEAVNKRREAEREAEEKKEKLEETMDSVGLDEKQKAFFVSLPDELTEDFVSRFRYGYQEAEFEEYWKNFEEAYAKWLAKNRD